MTENPEQKLVMALDPIHIGTGGYRLGRVDNTIVREPGTNLPKVPGTTINGSARTYAYLNITESEEREENNKKINKACALGKETGDESPCGECDVCETFGYATKDKSKAANVFFSDAQILFFPIHSMKGPVWITCPNAMKMINEEFNESVSENKVKTIFEADAINLGWLYLEKEGDFSQINKQEKIDELPDEIKNKLVLVSDKVFSQLVNSNLEVRTSVAIDPETGTAEAGALFTYEAIPRGTIFWFDITTKNGESPDPISIGLNKFETLGVGGMSSRGFGRLRLLEKENGDTDDSSKSA